MLAILATHPIQYQVPIWQQLAKRGKVPFEVWYLTAHGVNPSLDSQFGKVFKWDIEMLDGYPHRFPPVPVPQQLGGFCEVKLPEDFRARLKSGQVKAVLVHGWNVWACWEVVFLARRLGTQVWLRGESNDLKIDPFLKKNIKRLLLGTFLRKVDQFLVVGKANARLYTNYGVSKTNFYPSPYCVDNIRFSLQGKQLRPSRESLRRDWGIPDDAFCLVFVGKFIPKKRPKDIITALQLLNLLDPKRNYHILFVGAGELDEILRKQCHVVFDADNDLIKAAGPGDVFVPMASFVGFLNQNEISKSYIAADALVLASDHNETWGLVVNEALASGLPCIVSKACGSAEDLVEPLDPRLCFPMGDCEALANAIKHLAENPLPIEAMANHIARYDFNATVESIEQLWCELVK
jgi:glycosyltransferase involved in cell wall biosynthesis